MTDRLLFCGFAALALLTMAVTGAVAGDAKAISSSESKLPVRGIVRPLNQATISTDLSARVAKINFREAQAFHKGDLLMSFDCERLEAEQAAAEAVHREMKLNLESNVFLDKKGAVGRIDVEVSKARSEKAGAEARALAARIKQCQVIAPFDGRVTDLAINEHETPAPGKPLLSIVDETAFEIDVIIPSGWLKKLGPGSKFKFAIDETGKSYDVRVLRLGASVDPVSQTVKVIAAFQNSDDRVLAGMTGTALFTEFE